MTPEQNALQVALSALWAIDEDRPYPIAKHAILQINKVLRPIKSYANGEPQYATDNPLDIADRAYFAGKKDGIEEAFAQPGTPDDLLRQSEREGWRWAKECEAEVVRLTDLNQRLMAGAQELRDATDTAEFDEAWSKLFKLFKEAI